MKKKLNRLSAHYVRALRMHLKPGSRAGRPIRSALQLGREAVALGLETLQLARMHTHALVTLNLAGCKNGTMKRAEIFFTEVNTLIEETHRAARQSKVKLSRLKETLGQRTEQLAATHRQLERGVVRRKVLADAAGKSGKRHQECLAESLQLQARLRLLMRQVLSAQEAERKKISHELQDEIAQTLLGINVRLLTLKQAARNNTRGLKTQIASTQRLVVDSARYVRQFARELNVPQPAQTQSSSAKFKAL